MFSRRGTLGGTRGWCREHGACRPICALPLDLCATGAIESLVLVPRRLGGQVTYKQHVQAAQAYYRLCDEAESRGIPVSLDDPRSPQTVRELRAAVKSAS